MGDRTFFDLYDFRDIMDPTYVAKNKINTIKFIRGITDASLKDAKNFLEQEWEPFIQGKVRLDPQDPTETIEMIEILERLNKLEDHVRSLSSNQTKVMAKGIFDDNET